MRCQGKGKENWFGASQENTVLDISVKTSQYQSGVCFKLIKDLPFIQMLTSATETMEAVIKTVSTPKVLSSALAIQDSCWDLSAGSAEVGFLYMS